MQFLEVPKVFIAYREPNAAENFSALQKSCDNSEVCLISNIKGFDAAHKAALNAADNINRSASHFFTIDGDTQVLPNIWNEGNTDKLPGFVNQQVFEDTTFSWKSINVVNGLAYGNGGLKLWSKNFVRNMETHESVKGQGDLDFCWDSRYLQMEGITSRTYINASPEQAWRSGFREGIKLLLQRGKIPSYTDLGVTDKNRVNITRFVQWLCIGSHVQNGVYAMLGAAQGCVHVYRNKGDPSIVLDYDDLHAFWRNYGDVDIDTANTQLLGLRRDLATLIGIPCPTFGPNQSQTVVDMMVNRRSSLYQTESWQFLPATVKR